MIEAKRKLFCLSLPLDRFASHDLSSKANPSELTSAFKKFVISSMLPHFYDKNKCFRLEICYLSASGSCVDDPNFGSRDPGSQRDGTNRHPLVELLEHSGIHFELSTTRISLSLDCPGSSTTSNERGAEGTSSASGEIETPLAICLSCLASGKRMGIPMRATDLGMTPILIRPRLQ